MGEGSPGISGKAKHGREQQSWLEASQGLDIHGCGEEAPQGAQAAVLETKVVVLQVVAALGAGAVLAGRLPRPWTRARDSSGSAGQHRAMELTGVHARERLPAPLTALRYRLCSAFWISLRTMLPPMRPASLAEMVPL